MHSAHGEPELARKGLKSPDEASLKKNFAIKTVFMIDYSSAKRKGSFRLVKNYSTQLIISNRMYKIKNFKD